MPWECRRADDAVSARSVRLWWASTPWPTIKDDSQQDLILLYCQSLDLLVTLLSLIVGLETSLDIDISPLCSLVCALLRAPLADVRSLSCLACLRVGLWLVGDSPASSLKGVL